MDNWKTYLDKNFGNIEENDFHVDGYVYYEGGTIEYPYRAVQFCGCYIPNNKRHDKEAISLVEELSKQHIRDCSESEAKEIIKWYLDNCELL